MSCLGEVCHKLLLLFLENAQVELALGCCFGMSLAVDACSATALQQPQLIHLLKMGIKTHWSPETQRMCIVSPSVLALGVCFLFAEMVADF